MACQLFLLHFSNITYPGVVLLMTRILSSIFYISSMRKTSEEFNSDTVIEKPDRLRLFHGGKHLLHLRHAASLAASYIAWILFLWQCHIYHRQPQKESIIAASSIYFHIARTFSRTFNTIDGATDSSSTPILTNSCVSSVSAPNSPQIPAHFPHLCALSTTILIIRRIAL